MLFNKRVIIRPIKIKNKLLTINNKLNVYYLNEFGFYTNGKRILETIHSNKISKISLINIDTMEDVKSSNTLYIKDNILKYKHSWFTSDDNCILKVQYKDNTVKYFKQKTIGNNIKFYKTNDLITIVYIGEKNNTLGKLKDSLCKRYNIRDTKVFIKTFNSILPALAYILSNYVDIVITKDFMKDLSAKNLIKRIRISKSRIEFIVLSDNDSLEIENINLFKFSNTESLIKKLDSVILNNMNNST